MITFFQSSVNSKKLSLTIKGLIPLLILIAGIKGVAISEVELTSIVDAIVAIIGYVGVLITGIITLYGLIRRIGVKFQK